MLAFLQTEHFRGAAHCHCTDNINRSVGSAVHRHACAWPFVRASVKCIIFSSSGDFFSDGREGANLRLSPKRTTKEENGRQESAFRRGIHQGVNHSLPHIRTSVGRLTFRTATRAASPRSDFVSTAGRTDWADGRTERTERGSGSYSSVTPSFVRSFVGTSLALFSHVLGVPVATPHHTIHRRAWGEIGGKQSGRAGGA